jgi:uncharacterized protein YjbI with pentapeptide repeats
MKHQTLLRAAALMMLAGATSAYAFNGSQYQSIKDGKQACQWCDLNGADFQQAKLSGVDLSGTDLTGANLAGAILTKVNLTGVYLAGAVLSGAVFSGATFAGAHLEGADLTGIDAPGANFETAYCDWRTRLPNGWTCSGTVVERK